MKVVILAAGMGSRLRPLTDIKPKCLVEVAGKPILAHQLDAFDGHKIDHIYIITDYKASTVQKLLKVGKQSRLTIIENRDFDTINNMYSLWLARRHLAGQPFILVNGDVVFSPGILERLMSSDRKTSQIFCEPNQYNEESMKITVNRKWHIDDISKTITQKAAYGNSIDLYYFSAQDSSVFFEEVATIIKKEKETNQWTEVALKRLLNQSGLKMIPHNLLPDEDWMEIDNLEDLLAGEKKFSPVAKKLKDKKLIFMDLDGTVYLGQRLLPGAKKFISKLQRNRVKCCFLSNNSSRSKNDYVKRLKKLGLPSNRDQIILSTDGVLAFLKKKGQKRLYVIGTDSMKAEFLEQGFEVKAKKPEAVVLGFDTEVTYNKLKQAALFINQGVPFLATHPDLAYPTPAGPIPDAGAMIALLKATTGISPKIFGKPNKAMIEHLIEENQALRDEVVFIGDRLYTDGKLAQNAGIDFVCVLSGETPWRILTDSQGEAFWSSRILEN